MAEKSSQTRSISTVLVTGGSGTIGRAISQYFASEHWKVGVHYHRRQSEAEKTVQSIRERGGEGASFRADVRDREQVRQMIHTFKDRWGSLDTLVCATGYKVDHLVVRLPPREWTKVIETNLTGIFLCLKEAGSLLLAQGRGSVVIVGSLASLQGSHGQAAYAASKAGLLGLIKTVSQEWGASNVRINLVFPGWQVSKLSGSAYPTSQQLSNHVLGRTPNLEEVARTIYRVSQLHDVSGQVFNIDNRLC